MEETFKTEASRIELRLLRWMSAAVAAAVIVCLIAGHGRFAAGLAIGAALGILGYIWLHGAVAAVLAAVTDGSENLATKALVFKVVVRYPLFLGALYLFYRTNWLPVWAVLAGLLVPTAGAVVECLYQLGGMIFPSRLQRGQ